MKCNYMRLLEVGLILVLIGGMLSLAQDSDTESTSFTVTLNNTVRIDINATHQDDNTIDRGEDTPPPTAGTGADLYWRYFEEDADGFAQVCLNIYAISNYEVSVSNTISTTGGLDESTNALLEVEVYGFGSDVDASKCSAPIGNADDGADNPTSVIGNRTFGASPSVGTDVKSGDTVTLFTGGNTEGGDDNFVTAEIGFRLDLDAFDDAATGDTYTFNLTFTVTEK